MASGFIAEGWLKMNEKTAVSVNFPPCYTLSVSTKPRMVMNQRMVKNSIVESKAPEGDRPASLFMRPLFLWFKILIKMYQLIVVFHKSFLLLYFL